MLALEWHKLTGKGFPQPFLVELDGDEWTAATNTNAIVYVRGKKERAKPVPGCDAAYPYKCGTAFVHRVAFPELHAWCRTDATPKLPCAACGGTGWHPTLDDEQCGYCDAYGTESNYEWVEILGAHIDRILLWRYLSQLSADFVSISAADAEMFRPMLIKPDDDSWRVSIMPGRVRPATDRIVDHFPAALLLPLKPETNSQEGDEVR